MLWVSVLPFSAGLAQELDEDIALPATLHYTVTNALHQLVHDEIPMKKWPLVYFKAPEMLQERKLQRFALVVLVGCWRYVNIAEAKTGQKARTYFLCAKHSGATTVCRPKSPWPNHKPVSPHAIMIKPSPEPATFLVQMKCFLHMSHNHSDDEAQLDTGLNDWQNGVQHSYCIFFMIRCNSFHAADHKISEGIMQMVEAHSSASRAGKLCSVSL